MNVAILTITDGANYGNRLQNYALQELLKSVGCDTVTIQRKTFRDFSYIQQKKVVLKNLLKRALGKKSTTFLQIERKKVFNNFNREYISFADDILEKNKANEMLKDKYDYFVCGSDQIWNAQFKIIQEDIKNHLAFFARPNQRIAYAASFGSSEFLSEYKYIFKQELTKFKAIGVREQSGKRLVTQYCGREDATCVLDPTLMLSSRQWENIETKPKYNIPSKYILTYFLERTNEKLQNYIHKIAKDMSAEIISLQSEFLLDNEITNGKFFLTSPEEFVWLIHHSQGVLTDSFHAIAFSINFEKPFRIFGRSITRNNMNDRIESISNLLDLNIEIGNMESPEGNFTVWNIEKAKQLLLKEQRKSLQFLKDALV